MTKVICTLTIILLCTNNAWSQIGRLALSPPQKIEQTIGKTKITIEYSRPSKKGRDIFGALVPYEKYWRTGANQNTTIEFSEDVILENMRIKKGKYSIITKPGIETWEFILYEETNNWNVPQEIDPEKVISKTILNSVQNKYVTESFIITIGDFTNYNFDLIIKWDKTEIKVPFMLTTKEIMSELIKDKLEGPTGGDYYSAAVYQLESEKNYGKGIKWINQAIKIRKEQVWYDYWVKARLMIASNELKGITNVIDKGLKLAIEKENNYGISEFELIKSQIEE